jgi:hypothetical protein
VGVTQLAQLQTSYSTQELVEVNGNGGGLFHKSTPPPPPLPPPQPQKIAVSASVQCAFQIQ